MIGILHRQSGNCEGLDSTIAALVRWRKKLGQIDWWSLGAPTVFPHGGWLEWK